MATIDSRSRLHGKIGNAVYRTVGNTSIVQSRPGRVRQTQSTRESALEFGLVSNCGRILRELYASYSSYSDGRLLNRMNVALLKCLRDSEKPRGERDLQDGNPEHLKGLQFNIHSPLTEALAVRPECFLEEGKVRVHLPEFKENGQLLQPKYSRSSVLRLMVVAINFREGYYEYLAYQDIEIGRGAVIAVQDWQPEVTLPAGSMVLVSASLHYFGMRGPDGEALSLNSTACSPAEIIGAYKIAEAGGPAEEEETSVQHKSQSTYRHVLIDYRGRVILEEIARRRKRYNKQKGRTADSHKTEDAPVAMKPNMKLPVTGKVFYQKE
ncbi:hypothetical protein EIM50_20540 [Pseudoxanthomonas sp. SGD-10]|nr:hypothetical protein EIM50_20540 [Pseudoxanthomonas sp. SGD-10]